ncbi:MAG: DDE-type integrase/transposase/recombinase [Rhodobacteraceae bacterium]|nr:DDE-type integrase/transposase/recombinase [Paracoccaceae bacterium]
MHYPWRTVDHEGEVLEAFVAKRRDRKAALKFLRKTMKRYGIIHDPLELWVASDRALASSELVQVTGSENEKFTTRDFLAAEQALENHAREMANSGGFKVSNQHIEKAVKQQSADLQTRFGAILSDEQVTAIRHTIPEHRAKSNVGTKP